MINEYKHKQDIIEIGKRLYDRGFIVAGEGNLSIRISESEILTTPTGYCKGYLNIEDIIKTDLQGRKLSVGNINNPSSEIQMHLAVYQERPDVKAIVHAHPPIATGFAVAGIPLDQCILPEIIITIGSIPLAQYGTPSTDEIPQQIRELIRGRDALLLANHGSLTIGKDIYTAFYRMESVEQFARILLTARLLGGEKILNTAQIDRLIQTHPLSAAMAKTCVTGNNTPIESTSKSFIPTCTQEEGSMKENELVMKITKEIMKKLQTIST